MRNVVVPMVALLVLWSAASAPAQSAPAPSVFAGTWRPDPQRSRPDSPPDVFELSNGTFSCKSCKPPYSVKADGTPQPVNNPRYDTIAITAPNDHALQKTARKGGQTILESKIVISADGKTKTETQAISGIAADHSVDMAITSSRIAAGPPGSHAISGEWRQIEADLVHHDEDTTFTVDGQTLSMTDHLGRSFTARFDGSDSPYKGDPRFSSVSLKLLDERTFEETDKSDGKPAFVARWSVDADGKAMHARFDDMHGHIQEQTGHKLP